MKQLYYLPSASCAGFVIPFQRHFTLGCFFEPTERILQFASKLAVDHPSRNHPVEIRLPPAPYLFTFQVDQEDVPDTLRFYYLRMFQYAFDSNHNLQLAPACCPNVAPEEGRVCFNASTGNYHSPRTLLNIFWSGLFTESMVSTFPDLQRSRLSSSAFYEAYLSRFQQPLPAPEFKSASVYEVVFNDQTVSWIGSPDALYYDSDARLLIPAERIADRWTAQQPLPETLVAI